MVSTLKRNGRGLLTQALCWAILVPLMGACHQSPAVTQADAGVHPGQALYEARCASCHDQAVYKAPSRHMLGSLPPKAIVLAMTEGVMAAQSAGLAASEITQVAEFITGRPVTAQDRARLPPECDSAHQFDPAAVPVSGGWGVDLGNSRHAPRATGGLHAGNVQRLEVKWTFAYPNAYQARSQPIYGGGAIYVGSQDGRVWALDAQTGCLRWTFQARAEVRTGITIEQWSADDSSADPLLFFGDLLANVYAVSARTGELRWHDRADPHPDATVTGTPALHDGRLLVSVSSLEVISAGNPEYACCTFRGNLIAFEAATGRRAWTAYTIDNPAVVQGQTEYGTNFLGPSGAPIWSAPTIDPKRGLVYVGTGENYSSPADGNSDAIIAFELATGKKRWVSQQTAGDAWNLACFVGIPGLNNSNCPREDGPDFDFGSHPILLTLDDGTDLVIGGQKSGHLMALEPDTGEVQWKTRIGRGGIHGGVHFGIAAQGQTLYAPISDLLAPMDKAAMASTREPAPGVHALDAATGNLIWSAMPANPCGDLVRCNPGVSHAITAIDDAVIAGFLDGRLRIFARDGGRLLWERHFLDEYQSVSGDVAKGGSFSGGGVLVANGWLYANSGYGYNGHMPGNLLVALGLADN